VLLPGEATVEVRGEFVGRMRQPLVAAGEPFLVGFGIDPQLQVSRRLVRKSPSVLILRAPSVAPCCRQSHRR